MTQTNIDQQAELESKKTAGTITAEEQVVLDAEVALVAAEAAVTEAEDVLEDAQEKLPVV